MVFFLDHLPFSFLFFFFFFFFLFLFFFFFFPAAKANTTLSVSAETTSASIERSSRQRSFSPRLRPGPRMSSTTTFYVLPFLPDPRGHHVLLDVFSVSFFLSNLQIEPLSGARVSEAFSSFFSSPLLPKFLARRPR